MLLKVHLILAWFSVLFQKCIPPHGWLSGHYILKNSLILYLIYNFEVNRSKYYIVFLHTRSVSLTISPPTRDLEKNIIS
jgi:hypothetical protein